VPDIGKFIRACVAASRSLNPTAKIADLMHGMIADAAAVEAGVAAHCIAAFANTRVLYRAPDLTILDLRQAPGLRAAPHDHLMWVVSGVYRGQEDTSLYREVDGRLESTGQALQLLAPAVCVLEADDIHDVSNPLEIECANLQVCGGDFLAAAPRRRAWDIETGAPMPFPEYIERLLGARPKMPNS
jgi:predicted metal-dependent enzyme (double-stranded beta helix superfamily)